MKQNHYLFINFFIILLLLSFSTVSALAPIELRNDQGQLTEKQYVDADGRMLRMTYQNGERKTSLLYDPQTRKTIPLTPDVAEYIIAKEPVSLAILSTYAKTTPSFLSSVQKGEKLVNPRNDRISYELVDGALVTRTERNNLVWAVETTPDGREEVTMNNYPVDKDLARILQSAYGDEITSFDGQTARAGDKKIIIDGREAHVMRGDNEVEQISVVTEDGSTKVIRARSSITGGEREMRWNDQQGDHKRLEKVTVRKTPTFAEEEFTDAKGNTYFIKTDFVDGKPTLSTVYDASGYPAGRIKYDAQGKPLPEQSTKIEYLTKKGKVCDPTRDYLCPYQSVDMRIRVGNTIISDTCRDQDKNCKSILACTNDPACAQAYGETLRAFQKANFGIALNNAYIAARSAQFFNVKNFEFIDKLFSSEFGRLMLGEPSFGYCGQFSKRTASQEGVLVSNTPLRTMLAYVGAERTTIILPNQTKDYFYKLNYFVDAQEEEISFTIDLYRGESAIISLFVQDIKLPKGQRASARGRESIMQYSKNFYDKICLRSSKGVTCNRIIDIAELSPLPEKPSQGGRGGYRVF